VNLTSGPFAAMAEQVRRRREREQAGASKVCANCEGEGLVVIWGQLAHEVPASRQRHYPLDYPAGDESRKDKRPYLCPCCGGRGKRAVDE
jgi:hypothetical protein